MKTLRQAVVAFNDGDVECFLFSLKRAAFLTALHGEHTPSETRVMRAANRVLLSAVGRLKIVKGRS
jgi:hypothetical protein